MSLARRRGYARVQLWTHATNAGAQRPLRPVRIQPVGTDKPRRTMTSRSSTSSASFPSSSPQPTGGAAALPRSDGPDPADALAGSRSTAISPWEPPGGGIEPGEDPRLRRSCASGRRRPGCRSRPSPARRRGSAATPSGAAAGSWPTNCSTSGRLDAALDRAPQALTEVEAVPPRLGLGQRGRPGCARRPRRARPGPRPRTSPRPPSAPRSDSLGHDLPDVGSFPGSAPDPTSVGP